MSTRTTYLGPEVSFRTSATRSEPVHVLFPSAGTVAIAGTQLLSNATTASLTSATLLDGEIRIGSVVSNAAKLFWRSGNTTYQSTLTGDVL